MKFHTLSLKARRLEKVENRGVWGLGALTVRHKDANMQMDFAMLRGG